jgi:hypothetical protein
LERVLTRNLGPSSIPSLGDGVMLGTEAVASIRGELGLLKFHYKPATEGAKVRLWFDGVAELGDEKQLPCEVRGGGCWRFGDGGGARSS